MRTLHVGLRVGDDPDEPYGGRGTWMTLGVLYLVVAAGWLFHYDFARDGRLYSAAALAAFLVRVLGVHIGIVLLVGMVVPILQRRPWPTIVARVPLIAFLLLPLVDLSRTSEQGTFDRKRDDVRIMTSNLLYTRTGSDDLVDQVREANPDVLLVQEFTPAWQTTLAREIGDEFPHRVEMSRADAYGVAVYSKKPLEAGVLDLASNETPQVRAVIDRGDERDLVVYNLHLRMPLAVSQHTEQRREVAALVEHLERDREEQVVIAGDFNMTETTLHHAAIVDDAGYTSAWDAVERGRGATWPAAVPAIFGLRLDHVFVSPELRVLDIDVKADNGSDHRPVVVDLRPRG